MVVEMKGTPRSGDQVLFRQRHLSFESTSQRSPFQPPIASSGTLFRSNSPKYRSQVFRGAQNTSRLAGTGPVRMPKIGRYISVTCGKAGCGRAAGTRSGGRAVFRRPGFLRRYRHAWIPLGRYTYPPPALRRRSTTRDPVDPSGEVIIPENEVIILWFFLFSRRRREALFSSIWRADLMWDHGTLRWIERKGGFPGRAPTEWAHLPSENICIPGSPPVQSLIRTPCSAVSVLDRPAVRNRPEAAEVFVISPVPQLPFAG
jgi:hypothetical protein